jgi:hypothetical protein
MAEQQSNGQNEVQPVAPGTVVTPGGQSPLPTASVPAPQPQLVPIAAATPPAQPPLPPHPPQMPPQPSVPPQPPEQEPQQAPEQSAEVLADATEPIYQPYPATSDEPDSISWTASEFVAHDKSSEWYMLLGLGTVAAAGIMYVLTKDFVSVGVIILAAIIFAVYAAHKPRQLQYRVDLRGITIGGKTYGYDQFRSFSVVPEGAFSSIVFMPLKRFAVPVSIYYAPQDEEKIVELLSEQLPYEQRRRDAVDSLMRKVRF